MASLIQALTHDSSADTGRRSVRFEQPAAAQAPAPAASPPGPPDMSKNSTLKFVLSGLRSRFSSSAGSLRDMFREWDTDKSGDVDASELRVALHGLGFTAVSEADTEVLIANIDIGGEGRVQYEDFVRLLCPPRQETHAVTVCAADLARINAPFPPTEVNLPGRVFFLGGRAVKRVLGPGEAAALRQSSIGDVGNGVASDALRESVRSRADEAESAIRRTFYSDLLASGSSARGQQLSAVSEAAEDAAAQDAGLSSLRVTSTSAGASPPAAAAAARKRTTARREELVELASLPPAVQVNALMTKGLLPKFELDHSGARPIAPWEGAADEHQGAPTMDQLIAAAHASNAAAKEFAARVAAGQVSMQPAQGDAHGALASSARGIHVNSLVGAEGQGGALEPLPTHLSLPLSPLAHTARAAARRPQGLPTLQLPGAERGALAPSSTVNLAHPLSYLTALGSSALAPPPSLLHTLVAGSAGAPSTSASADAAATATPRPNTLDRSLHSSSRLPPRAEGLQGPFSTIGAAAYNHETVHPDGGSDTVVVGHLQAAGKGCESLTAVGDNGAVALAMGPFFSSTVQRDLDRRIGRLRLSARDVLEVPGAGRATAPHITALEEPVPPFSPLTAAAAAAAPAQGARSTGSGGVGIMRANFFTASSSSSSSSSSAESPQQQHPQQQQQGSTASSSRTERYEARRREFYASTGGEAPGMQHRGGGAPPTSPMVTLGERLSSSKNARQSRMSSILGMTSALTAVEDRAVAVAAAAAAAGEAEGGGSSSSSSSSSSSPVPALALGSLTSHSTAPNSGSSRVLASAVRHEGERTTYLLSPPPGQRMDCTPEHPSWHYASSARLAQTGTLIPEQAFGRLTGMDKYHNLRVDQGAREARQRAQHEHDFAFEQMDIASRIARKREERGAYRANIMARKQAQEGGLCAPFPVPEVQV